MRAETDDGQTGLVIDYEFWDKQAIAEIKLLATPLDFDDLIARGILKKASRGWYWLLVKPKDWPDDSGAGSPRLSLHRRGEGAILERQKGREAGAPTCNLTLALAGC